MDNETAAQLLLWKNGELTSDTQKAITEYLTIETKQKEYDLQKSIKHNPILLYSIDAIFVSFTIFVIILAFVSILRLLAGKWE